MPLRIGFDLDGVLADMESALVQCATDVFGEAMIERLQQRANESADADSTAPAADTEGASDTGGPTVADDRPENCLDVVTDSKARAVLVWREKQQGLPTAARRLGIGVVESLTECLNIHVQIDTIAPEEKTGVFNRVMRILRR